MWLVSQARSKWADDQETAVREAVGVAKAKWEEESRKRVESALREQEAVWQKRYLLYKPFRKHSYLFAYTVSVSTTLVGKISSQSNKVISVLLISVPNAA